jgi:hypothetical protein
MVVIKTIFDRVPVGVVINKLRFGKDDLSDIYFGRLAGALGEAVASFIRLIKILMLRSLVESVTCIGTRLTEAEVSDTPSILMSLLFIRLETLKLTVSLSMEIIVFFSASMILSPLISR